MVTPLRDFKFNESEFLDAIEGVIDKYIVAASKKNLPLPITIPGSLLDNTVGHGASLKRFVLPVVERFVASGWSVHVAMHPIGSSVGMIYMLDEIPWDSPFAVRDNNGGPIYRAPDHPELGQDPYLSSDTSPSKQP